jgi:hypothetical protein
VRRRVVARPAALAADRVARARRQAAASTKWTTTSLFKSLRVIQKARDALITGFFCVRRQVFTSS